MAKTITPKFTLTGSAADWGAAIALSVTDTLTCEAPSKGLSRIDVAAAATPTLLAAGSAGTTFFYIKNNNTSGTASVQIETAGGTDFGTLENGEFAWIPVDDEAGLRLTGVTASVEVEYGYWHRT